MTTPPKDSAASSRDPFVGAVVGGKYRIVGLLGRGGGGRVYKGVQEPLGRFVAVKVLGPLESEAWDPEMQIKRFLREATVTSKLTHPNTVVVYDYGALPDGGLYLVMEYLEGPTLRHLLSKDAPLSVGRAVRIARQIAGSLADAHEQGVVHRDLKPPNVMLVARGGDREFVKVLDFGLVKSLMSSEEDMTRERSLLGSPHYMSPEQAIGEPVDQRSDIYSFGSTLYEMLCGQAPFRHAAGNKNELTAVLRAVLSDPPLPFVVARATQPASVRANDASIPASLERLVMACLAKRPSDRPASMYEVIDALDAVIPELPVEESASRRQPLPPSPSFTGGTSVLMPSDAVTPSRARPASDAVAPARKSWAMVAVGGALAVAGLIALILAAPWRQTVSPPSPLAAAPKAGAKPAAAAPDSSPDVAPTATAPRAQDGTAEPGPTAPDVARPANSPTPTEPDPPPVPAGAVIADPVTALPDRAPFEVEAAARTRRPTEPTAAVATFVLRVTTTPEQAEVFDGKLRLGLTPLAAPLPRARLGNLTISIQKAGFTTRLVPVGPSDGPEVEVLVSLDPVKVAPPRVPSVPRPPRPPQNKPSLDIKTTR